MPGDTAESGKSGPISIDDLAALNEEITALVRAGVPLDRGLLRAGEELPGTLKRITEALGQRLSRGESLQHALKAEDRAIPPLYRAVVEAGARSGRLPMALEGLARYIRGYSEARQAIGVALWYPLLVLTMAYGLFLGLVMVFIPRLSAAFESLGLSVAAPVRWLERVGELAPYWWPLWPLLLVVLAVFWRRSGQAASFQALSWSPLRWFPWMRSVLSDYEAAGFADMASQLLEHQVPFAQAVTLAADATGNAEMSRGARQFALAIERGATPGQAITDIPPQSFRPLLRWTLALGNDQGSLVESLRGLAPMYRKRAADQAEKLRVFLPVLLMLGIGGSATFIYGLTLFVPLSLALAGLSAP